MKESSAIAKLSRPRTHGAHLRQRLFAQLDDDGVGPIIWIAGPPGAGKTTLAATWIESRGLASCWYRVDQRDADPATLFYYLGEAARRLLHRTERPAPLFAPEYARGLATFARRFFETLCAGLPRPCVLVFDDYHDLPMASLTHAALQHGLRELPPGIRVLILSRAEPPAEFARFRVAGEMATIPPHSLRLADDEVGAIARRRGIADAVRIGELAARAQGWAAGLRLLLGMEAADPAAHRDAAPEALFEYFAGEVFRLLADAERRVLMMAALLPSCTDKLAAELADEETAGDILERFYRRNYFVTRDDADDAAQYRLHPLFRDFLRAQTRLSFSREERARLRIRAAEWLAAQGKIEGAVALRQAAHDDAGVAALVVAGAEELLKQGRHRTVAGWIEALPKERRAANPWLLYWQGMAHLPFGPVVAQPIFEAAFALFVGGEDVVGIYLSWAAAVQSIRLDHTCDGRQLDRWIELLDELRVRHPEFPSEWVEYRVAHSAFAAMQYRKPLHPHYLAWRDRAVQLARRSLRLSIEAYATYSTATAALMSGRLDEAEAFLASSPPLEAPGLKLLGANAAYLATAMDHLYRGRFVQGLRVVDEGLGRLRPTGVNVWTAQLAGVGVALALGMNDLPDAELRLDKLATDANVSSGTIGAYFRSLSARTAYIAGRYREALHFANDAQAMAERSGWGWPEVQAHFAASLAGMEAGDHEQAKSALDAMRRRMNEGHGQIYEMGWRLARARLALLQGDPPGIADQLREALGYGLQHGHIEFGHLREEVLAGLLAQALALGIEPDYARRLIRLRRLRAPAGSEDVWPIPIRIQTLGSFEILLDDTPLRFSHKAPRKPLELLQAIVAFGSREAPADSVRAALWPDAEGDTAATSLRVTLSRLRKLLGHETALIFDRGRLGLDRRLCRTDVDELEQLLARMETAPPGDVDPLAAQLLRLYRGGFLAREHEQAWVLPLRDRLHGRFVAAVATLGQRLETIGAHRRAIDLYRHALEQDNLAEPIYRQLIRAHRALGQEAEALAVFRRCRQMLSVVLGVAPSRETAAAAGQLRE